MGEDFRIRNVKTGQEWFLHLCSASDVRSVWQPACDELKLEILSILGSLTWVSKEYEDLLFREMRVMSAWLGEHAHCSDRHRAMSDNLAAVLQIIDAHSRDDLDLTFL